VTKRCKISSSEEHAYTHALIQQKKEYTHIRAVEVCEETFKPPEKKPFTGIPYKCIF
jgi:hypothetical protein